MNVFGKLSAPAVLLGLLLVAGCAGQETGNTGGPSVSAHSVVLITVDGLVPSELELFGGPKATPNLSALAEGGRAWDDGWTVSPMSRPAVATYLTGWTPDRHGVRDDLFAALPETAPTLAVLLAERGFETAAFPDSSFLGRQSGLLRGFAVADEPPPSSIGPERWLPELRRTNELAADFETWLTALEPDRRYFAWVHFARPLRAQFLGGHLRSRASSGRMVAENRAEEADDEEPSEEDLNRALADVDEAVGRIVSALSDRGDLDGLLLIVAGTQGDQRGSKTEMRGPGFSLDEKAVRVPVIARFPAGSPEPRAADGVVWAPDIPRTIAQAAGLALGEECEGVSLLEEPAKDRILFNWGWATRDQMGLRPLRGARSGSVARVEGPLERTWRLGDGPAEIDPAEESRLAEAIASRPGPPKPAVPLDKISPILEAHGLTLRPVAEPGRTLGPGANARSLAKQLWGARRSLINGRSLMASRRYDAILSADPDNLGALIDRGQLLALSKDEAARPLLEGALERYPDDPELLHWYAHAVWSDAREEAEQILLAILPYKPGEADVLYDLACARSLADDLPASERYLRRAIEAGFREWRWMQMDSDLRNLRQSPAYSALLKEYGQ